MLLNADAMPSVPQATEGSVLPVFPSCFCVGLDVLVRCAIEEEIGRGQNPVAPWFNLKQEIPDSLPYLFRRGFAHEFYLIYIATERHIRVHDAQYLVEAHVTERGGVKYPGRPRGF